MDYSSRGLVCDPNLGPDDHRPLRIGDCTHNAARTDGLSQQQRRSQQQGRRREHVALSGKDSRGKTASPVEVQDRKPSIRSIHRTSLKVLVQKLGSWIGNRRSMGLLGGIGAILQPCLSESERYQTIHHPCQSLASTSGRRHIHLDDNSILSCCPRVQETAHEHSRERNWRLVVSAGFTGHWSLAVTSHWPLTFRSPTSLCSSLPDVARGTTKPRPARKLRPECGETASSTCVVTGNKPAGTAC